MSTTHSTRHAHTAHRAHNTQYTIAPNAASKSLMTGRFAFHSTEAVQATRIQGPFYTHACNDCACCLHLFVCRLCALHVCAVLCIIRYISVYRLFIRFLYAVCVWVLSERVCCIFMPCRGNNLPIHPVMQSFSLYHVAFIMKIMYIPILADKYEVK